MIRKRERTAILTLKNTLKLLNIPWQNRRVERYCNQRFKRIHIVWVGFNQKIKIHTVEININFQKKNKQNTHNFIVFNWILVKSLFTSRLKHRHTHKKKQKTIHKKLFPLKPRPFHNIIYFLYLAVSRLSHCIYARVHWLCWLAKSSQPE